MVMGGRLLKTGHTRKSDKRITPSIGLESVNSLWWRVCLGKGLLSVGRVDGSEFDESATYCQHKNLFDFLWHGFRLEFALMVSASKNG